MTFKEKCLFSLQLDYTDTQTKAVTANAIRQRPSLQMLSYVGGVKYKMSRSIAKIMQNISFNRIDAIAYRL